MPRYTGARPIYSGRVDHTIVVNKRASETPVQVVEAFSSAMAGLFDKVPGTIAELRTALGGTNKAAAALGVAPRSIQRYIAAEELREVSAHSKRRADIAKRSPILDQLQRLAAPQLRAKTEAAMEADGVVMQALGSLRIAPDYTEGRFIRWLLEGRYWAGARGILAAWRAGKRQLAARRWNRAFGESYGLPGARWSYLNELTFTLPDATK